MRATERIGVGMLGYGFMGRAHAYRTLTHLTSPPLEPELVSIAGRDEAAVADAAARFGFADHVADWRELVADERVGLFDDCGPNQLHAERDCALDRSISHP